MQRICLAPVLSATFSRDSCWITAELLSSRRFSVPCARVSLAELLRTDCGLLLGLVEDLDDAPTLGRRQRPRLHDEDAVADAGRAGLVVGLHLAGTADDLAVQRVLDAVLDLDDDGLLHLVADDQTLAHLALGTGRSGHVLAHHAVTSVGAAESPSSRSRMIV